MPEFKIHEYPNNRTAATSKDDDFLDWDATDDLGVSYESKKMSKAEFRLMVQGFIDTIYTSDGSLTENRVISAPNFTTTFDGGSLASKSDGTNDNGFLLFNSLGAIRGGIAYDVSEDNSSISLFDSLGANFFSQDGKIRLGSGISSLTTATAHIRSQGIGTNEALLVQDLNGVDLFNVLDNGFVGVGVSAPTSNEIFGVLGVSTFQIPSTESELVNYYQNRVGGANIGDNYNINYLFNDSLGNETVAARINTRVESVAAGVVDASITFSDLFSVNRAGSVVITPGAATSATSALFDVRGTGSTPNHTAYFKSGGNTTAYRLLQLINSDGKNLFYVDAAGRGFFNQGQLSAGDFQLSGAVDANLIYTDASTDRVGFGLSNPSEKVDVAGNINASGDYKVGGVAGFTGTGAYTNFTIVGGIITNAS